MVELNELASIRPEWKSAGGSCRFCGAELRVSFADLGVQPLCQSVVTPATANAMEPFYPLHAYVCDDCFLVQVGEYVSPDGIFTEYAYFSAYSDSWLDHARRYVDMITDRVGVGGDSLVVEVGSNDGYLLQYFVQKGIPVLGIDPAANVAEAARERGVPTLVRFFGIEAAKEVAGEGKLADLICGANVMAQVPDINDFVAGLKLLLAPGGVVTIEFPHLLTLIAEREFDTIYHEHFSYFSFRTTERIFAAHGLTLFDVEELPTHGGSLRIYARHTENESLPATPAVAEMRAREEAFGLTGLDRYVAFGEEVKAVKRDLLAFLIEAKRAGKRVAGYGAAGKGNTLLNYCGIGTDFLDFTVDRNPYKQGTLLPGSRIPVFPPDHVFTRKPDYLLILPWNLKREIMEQMAAIHDWGGKFVIPIPGVEVVE
jgi:SAM-dependent methyltransferase